MADVWEGEPEISEELLREVNLGTSHIAGYSLDGKANATLLIYQATCRFLNVPGDWKLPGLSPPPCPEIKVDARSENDAEILSQVVGRAYDLERDDRALREILKIPSPQRKKVFDQLRSEYPIRREFNSIEVNIKGGNETIKNKLRSLGFQV